MNKRIATVETAVAHQAKDVNILKHSVDLIGRTVGFEPSFLLTTMTFSAGAPELVSPCLPREKSVSEILARLQNSGSAVLVAEPGSGKTQLLLLSVTKTGRVAHWLDMPRKVTEVQACMLLDSLIQIVSGELTRVPFRELCSAPL